MRDKNIKITKNDISFYISNEIYSKNGLLVHL